LQRARWTSAPLKLTNAISHICYALARVNKVISESRVGYSICRLLDHVRHWHAWSKRDDFQQYVGFPAADVTGTRDKVENYERITTDFRYPPFPIASSL
jgi:hypothetical protein